MERSETFMPQNARFHALDVLFRGIVDDKSCLGVQIAPKPNFGGPNGITRMYAVLEAKTTIYGTRSSAVAERPASCHCNACVNPY